VIAYYGETAEDPQMSLFETARRSGYWLGCFLIYVVAIAAAGGVFGSVMFPLFGKLLSVDRTVGQLAFSGLRQFSFLFGIWAPAISIVICVMRAHRRAAEDR
jgi:uncharacterized membrane protein YhaH (DUF805 family)